MVRMSDLIPAHQKSLPELDCPVFDTTPLVTGPALAQRTVALISSAGLMMRGDRPIVANDTKFRPIAHDAPADDVLMSHVSVGFDRTGFQRDMNVVLPRDRLQEMVDAGAVGAAATNHYAAMGATHPDLLEGPTRELAATLRDEGVDSALLLPV